jgi:glycosyltransferase involved in cell wall biosynthesis
VDNEGAAMSLCDGAKTLTIAVPAYNSEWCLEKCLSSFADDCILSRIEVIVINDGSTDGTRAIAESFAQRYPECFRVVNKENGGHGSAINAAIELARGRYFKVVDSDDWVRTENMTEFLDVLDKSDADVVVTHFRTVDMNTGELREFRTSHAECGSVYSLDGFMELPIGARSCLNFHGITYNTEYYRNTEVKLTEGVFYEDQEYATSPFYMLKSLLPVDIFLYEYLVNNAAQSTADEVQVRRLSHQEAVLKSIIKCYNSYVCAMSLGCLEYFKYKISEGILAYYVNSMVKNPDKRGGRMKAERLRAEFLVVCPEAVKWTDNRYRLLRAMSLLHMNSGTLGFLKSSSAYMLLRRMIRRI